MARPRQPPVLFTNAARKENTNMADAPDFERIAMLLEIVHNSLDVPGVEHIRADAMEELKALGEESRIRREESKKVAADEVAKAEADKAAAAKRQTPIERDLYGPVDDPNTYHAASKFSNEGVPVTAPAESTPRSIPSSSIAEKIRGN